ncbi:MAG: bifunctional UDP-sugar hydrolase/5'-nucleotidase [Saprospiraceae bacterium]
MRQIVLSLWLLLLIAACQTSQPISTPAGAENIELTILQMNDVYEIAPLEGGKAGGLARVASVKKALLKENPNTIAILAGDFLSPSFVGTLRNDEGERIAGQQMVETLNALGLDYVTFGNHEFDISDPLLLKKRMDQSQFEYISCNAFWLKDGKQQAFVQKVNGQDRPVPKYIIRTFKNSQGKSMKVGFIGVVLPFSKQDYLVYSDVEESFRQAYEEIKSQVDICIGITHLDVVEDQKLAAAVPGVALFIGGHDHTNMNHYVENTIITKADANAKTVYVHRLTFNPPSGMFQIRSSLLPIDESIADDPVTKTVVDRWQKKVNVLMDQMGFDPDRKLLTISEPLVCKEALVRTQSTNFGRLATSAMSAAIPGADVYLMNGGSMRLDDNLFNIVTEYDVLRTFPFGGPIVTMEIPGNSLLQLLDTGLKTNRGDGGYLQLIQAEFKDNVYLINGARLQANKNYKIILPEFLAQGKEQNLAFLGDFSYEKKEHFLIDGKEVKNDIRNIVIAYFLRLGSY